MCRTSMCWFSNSQTVLKGEILISFLGEQTSHTQRKQAVISKDEVFGNSTSLIILVNASPFQMFQHNSLCSC